jgi:RNase P subunit RPR2
MKIVKNNVFIKITCSHCKSKLKVFEKDIKVVFVFGHGTSITVICLACDKEISLKSKQLREEWQHLLINPEDE